MGKSLTLTDSSTGDVLYPKTLSSLVYDNSTGDTIKQTLDNKQDKLTIANNIFDSSDNDILSAIALKTYLGIQRIAWEFTYEQSDINNAYIYQTAPHVWHDGDDKWYSVMVPLEGHGTITVTKNPAGSCRYAFLRSNSLVINSLPDFCSGTDLIQVTDSDPITYNIPSDCRYFYAYVISTTSGTQVNVAPTVTAEVYANGGGSSTPTTIDPGFIKLRYMHWNIGHFALGSSSDTTTTHADYPTQHAKWVQHVNTINADVFGCCEYNTNFVNASGSDPAIVARDDIFSPYKYAYVGTKTGYNQQAIFSNKPFTSTNEVTYSQVYQAGRYYLVGAIPLGSYTVKIVETHLDLNQSTHTGDKRTAQIQQLITDFANDDYVIIAGDFNVADTSEYDTFKNAGYTTANHGYLGDIITQPAKSACADNIICKGFAINNIQTVDDQTVTDHKGIYADLTLL